MKHRIIKHSTMLCLLTLGLSLGYSCRDDREDMLASEQVSPAQTATKEASLVGTRSSAGEEGRLVYLSLSADFDSQEMRAAGYTEDELGQLTQRNVKDEETAHVILRQKGKPEQTVYVDITWRGRSGNRLYLDHVPIRVPNSISLEDGEWYITACIGGNRFDMQSGKVHLEGSADAPRSVTIPYIFPWTRLDLGREEKVGTIPVSLHFRPHGALMRLQYYNNMLGDYRVQAVRIRSNAWGDTGVFDPMALSDEEMAAGGYPRWRATHTAQTPQTMTYALGDGTDNGVNNSFALPAMAAWDKAKTVYIWGMPTEVEQDELSTKIETQVRYTAPQPVGIPEAVDWVTTYDKERHRPILTGATYRLSNIVTSEPIISEVFYDYAGDGDPQYPGRNNYSIVEIYNPTATPIDLREYALARLVRAGEGYRYYGVEAPRGLAPNGEDLKNALLLPLSALSGNKPHKDPFGDGERRIGKYEDTYYRHLGGDKSTFMLAPGKTLLIGAPGYVRTGHKESKAYDAFDEAVRSGQISASDLAVGSKSDPKYTALKTKVQEVEQQNAMYPRAGGQIDSALSRGYAQLFFAVDNRREAGRTGMQANAALMSLHPNQGVALVRYSRVTKAPELVDASLPVTMARGEEYMAQRLSIINEGYEGRDRILLIDDHSIYAYSTVRAPGHNFAKKVFDMRPKAWLYERSENNGFKSLGSRDYVAGLSPYAGAWAGYTTVNNSKGLPFWQTTSSHAPTYTKPWDEGVGLVPTGGAHYDGATFSQDQAARKAQSKLSIASAVASKAQRGQELSKAIDGNLSGQIYHSPWSGQHLPIDLTFTFDTPREVGSLIYYPRNDGSPNGNFERTELWYSTDGTNYQKLQDINFSGDNSVQEVAFVRPVNAKSIRIKVLSGRGGWASAREIEFYGVGYNPNAYGDMAAQLFADKACTKLQAGITREQILAHSDPFLRNIALRMLEGKYPREFRIDDFKPYVSPDVDARVLKTNPFSRLDNPTGIAVKAQDKLIVFVGDTYGAKPTLRIQNLDRPQGDGFGGLTYTIKEGFNEILVKEKGLVYVEYYVPEANIASAKPIRMHFATGTVNGYFDTQRPEHRGRWRELLGKATDQYFDLVGEFSHMTYETATYRQHTPSGEELANLTDLIVRSEMEHLGLYKYNRVRRNRLYMHVMYHSYMYATWYHTGYNYGTMGTLASAANLRSGYWGPAHEIGHMNQTSGLKWKSTTECTVNISSFHIGYNVLKLPTRMRSDKEDRYRAAWNGLLRRNFKMNHAQATLSETQPHVLHQHGVNVFERLVPFIQLELYMGDVLGKTPTKQADKGGFYPDVYEYLRTNPTARNPQDGNKSGGWEQTEFAYIASKVSGYDLTDFFTRWGFFAPVDTEVDDYGKQQFIVTAERAAEVRDRIKALNLPKLPAAMEYITEENTDLFRSPRTVQLGRASKSGRAVTLSDFAGVVAYEVVNASGEVIHIDYGHAARLRTNKTTDFVWDDNYRLYAVAASGARTAVPVN